MPVTPEAHSRLDAAQLVAAADARTRGVPEDVTALSILELDALIDLVQSVVAIFDELLRRIPGDADRVPDGAVSTDEGRAYFSSKPERFLRASLEAERAAWNKREWKLIRLVGERRDPAFAARNRALSDMMLAGLKTPEAPEHAARREADELRKQQLLAEYHRETRERAAADRARDQTWARVLAEPGSLRAREALLDDWKKRHDPRAELLEAQLTLDRHVREQTLGSPEAQALYRQVNLMKARDGKRLAGELGTYVEAVEYFRGLVAGVRLPGARFRALASTLFQRAPLQHLTLTRPLGPLAALFEVPQLSQLVSLSLAGVGADFGDAGAKALAASPHVANLRWLDLSTNAISREGIEALVASPHLARVEFLGLTGNPASTTTIVEGSDGYYTQQVPELATDLAAKFGPRPWLGPVSDPERWPPDRDSFAVVDTPA